MVPTPMSTTAFTISTTASTTTTPVQLETPSVQQLLAQPGFSSGVLIHTFVLKKARNLLPGCTQVLIHTGPRHPQFASLASR